MTESNKKVSILLVEDNPGDARLTMEAFKDLAIEIDFRLAPDGHQALAMLRKEAPYENEVRPDLILLDLNLPGIDGREVLYQIKHNRVLKKIPVVVLSTSEDENDIAAAYELHGNAFITKPVELEQFARVVQLIHAFWLTTVKLPL